MKKTAALILIAAIICSGLYLTFKRDLDQFNPLYKEKYVYAVINEAAAQEGKNEWIRYRYNLTGYTAVGEKKEVTFSSSKKQEPGAYVRVLAKGDYTKEWILITKEAVPTKAMVSN